MPDVTQSANAPKQSSAAFPLGLAFGAAAGVILSSITGHWGLWLPVGIGVGTAVGLALSGAGAAPE